MFMFVQGHPGIGKPTLVSQLTKDYYFIMIIGNMRWLDGGNVSYRPNCLMVCDFCEGT